MSRLSLVILSVLIGLSIALSLTVLVVQEADAESLCDSVHPYCPFGPSPPWYHVVGRPECCCQAGDQIPTCY